MKLLNRDSFLIDNPNHLTVKPVVRVLFFFLLCTYSYNHIFKIGINIYLSDFFVGAILLLSLIEIFVCSKIYRFSRLKFLFFLLFFYYLFLLFYSYAFLGNEVNEVLGRFRMLFFYPLLFFCGLAFTTNKKDIETFYTLIKIFVFISVVLGIVSFLFPGFETVHQFKNSTDGVVVTETPYFMLVPLGTALLCCLIFIGDFLGLLGKSKKVIVHSFFITISLVGILGTQNRGIIIVFLFAVLLIFFFSRKSEPLIRIRARKVFVLFIIMLAGLLLLLFRTPLRKRFEGRIDETVQTITGESSFFRTITGIRVGRTIVTFKEWLKTPILGCGWGNQLSKYEIYDFQGNYVRTNYGTPHNYYITILYQTGLIGFSIMMVILYMIYQRISPGKPLSRVNTLQYTFFIFYVIFLVFNFGNTHLYGDPVFIPVNFFIIGVAFSYSEQVKTGKTAIGV